MAGFGVSRVKTHGFTWRIGTTLSAIVALWSIEEEDEVAVSIVWCCCCCLCCDCCDCCGYLLSIVADVAIIVIGDVVIDDVLLSLVAAVVATCCRLLLLLLLCGAFMWFIYVCSRLFKLRLCRDDEGGSISGG